METIRLDLDPSTLRAALARLGPQVLAVAQSALYREGERLMTESKSRCPVDTGALRASGQVSPPELEGATVVVTLGYGGPAVGYAVFVHENLRAHHPVGEAKFLERPVLEQAGAMGRQLASAIRTAMAARSR